MRYGPPFKTSSEMAWLTLKTALHGKKELLDVSFSCQGTARYHSLSWHFLILVLALFDRKVKMQPGINSENMIHSLWVGWATTPHIGFEIPNWFKIPMMVVKGVSSKPSGNRKVVLFFVFRVRDFKFWLLACFLISFNCAKFQKDGTTLM